jgi:threonine dehydratase
MIGNFHIKTSLIYSDEISAQNSSTNVYLKLENSQPSGSFKIRGIGNMILKSNESGQLKQIISSSGGNAGLAVAYSSKQLKIKGKIFVPKSTPQQIIDKLK